MGDSGSTAAFYAARPKIEIEGHAEDALGDGMVSMFVEETTEGLYRCEAVFGNWGNPSGEVGFVFFDRALLDFGKKISITIGDEDTKAKIFEGRIAGMEGIFPQGQTPEFRVLAEDRFQDLRMTRRTRTFDDVSDSDVISQIASEHGLRADVDVDGPTYKVLAQVNQSNLKFIRDRARACDAEVWLEGDTLKAKARARRDGGTVTLTYGSSLHEAAVLADIAQQRTALIVSGWDVSAKEAVEHEAGDSAISSEMNGLTSGNGLLQSAFGARKERIVHMVPFTTQEAQAFAEARYRDIARRFVTGSGLSAGDARIKVGTFVDLKGMGPLFEGKYYVTLARHTFDSMNGYRTYFEFERPGLGAG